MARRAFERTGFSECTFSGAIRLIASAPERPRQVERSTRYEAWNGQTASLMGGRNFPGADRRCGRGAQDGASCADRGPWLSSARGFIQSSVGAVRGAGRLVCAPSDPYVDSYCSWNAFYDSRPAAIQLNNSSAALAMASFERACFCHLRTSHRNFSLGDELWDAGNRRHKSGGGNYLIWRFLLIRVVQGVLAYPAARDSAAPRVDDPGICGGTRGRYDSADHWSVFCDESSYRFDAA